MKVSRAATYLRMSLDDGTDYAELGIDRQRDAVRHLAQAKGWVLAPDFEIVDQGVSASKKRQRPGFVRLLRAIEHGQVDGVLAYAVDRLARRLEDLQTLIEVAERHHVPVTTVSGDLDLSNASGQGMAKLLGVIAEMETKRLGERMTARKHQDARRGQFRPGGRRAYAFKWVKTTPTKPGWTKIVAKEAKVIRDVADRLISGVSPSSIVSDLNRRGVPTACDTGWSLPRLRSTLSRPALCGKVTWKGEILFEDDGSPVRGDWKPILTDDVYDDLQIALAASRRKPGPTAWNGRRRHLLSGITRCGLCEAPMWGFEQTNKQWTYACSRQKHLTRNKAMLEEHVIAEVKARALATTFEVGSWSDAEADEVRQKIARLEEQQRDTAAAFVDRAVSADMLLRIDREISDRLDDLRGSQVGRAVEMQTFDAVQFDLGDLEQMPMDEQRAAIAMLVTRIVVEPQGRGKRFDPDKIRIEWRDLSRFRWDAVVEQTPRTQPRSATAPPSTTRAAVAAAL